jgi:predicted CoA-binding protein
MVDAPSGPAARLFTGIEPPPGRGTVSQPPATAYPDRFFRAILGSVKTIAMVGATPNPARPAYLVMKYLLSKGYRVIPVNPGHAGAEILGQKTYARLADIPEPIDMVDIFRRADAIPGVVEEALALDQKPRVVWMQLGLRDEAAAARAEAAGVTVVMDRCPKIEYGRLCGENSWAGINSGTLSAKKPRLAQGFQRLDLDLSTDR